ncbi:MAG TPA: Xaa-Pro peptidase family protein [Chloroflexia bacterium]|nr:Xaa-Pro peptidase family protein [Chloroflexia bacterium]
MDQARLAQMQAALRTAGIDGWLFYDFRRNNPIAYTVLGVNPEQTFTRRWYYFVPAQGDPARLVSALEAGNLDGLPGPKIVYQTRQDLAAGLAQLLAGHTRLAMEYSPLGALPIVSRVDAGTVDYLRAQGKEVVSSADIVQAFEATWSADALATHLAAEQRLATILRETLAQIRTALARGESLTEYGVQQEMLARYRQHDLFCDHGPIVASGPNSGNPHYEPAPDGGRPVAAGDLLLIDWWGKLRQPGAVYADYTWVGFLGSEVPARYGAVFDVVCGARDAAIALVRRQVQAGTPLQGWEVDDVARAYITERGYGPAFVHRTGHNIGQETHGNGANLDNFETQDTRRLLPHTCFSIEPGIYLPEFGIRSEVNVVVQDGDILVTGRPIQQALPAVLAE